MPSLSEAVRRGWLGPIAGLAALALYARTLAPGLTWAHEGADGGDMLAAALTGGVPHPTGYPTYQLLLIAACKLYPGEPARAGNWLSAVAAACAVGLLADLAHRVLADGWPRRPGQAAIALAAALSWAASPLLWSQAVITEVYALHALAVMLVLWLLWRWREVAQAGGPAGRWLAAAGLVFGLGSGNHLSLMLLLPAAAAWLWDNRRLRPSAGQSTPPASQTRQLRAWAAPAATLALGLSVYAYLPLAAMRQAPVNWGNPRTLAGFLWVVSGQPYAELLAGAAPAALLARVAAWGQMALGQLGGGPWGLLIAVAGLWWTDRRQHAWWRTTGLVALAYTIFSLAYRTADSYVYLLPVWAMTALWLAAGLGGISALVQDNVMLSGQPAADDSHCELDIPLHRDAPPGMTVIASAAARSNLSAGLRLLRAIALAMTCHAAIAALILLPAGAVLHSWRANDLSRDQEARDFVTAALDAAGPGAVILVATDRPTFALWYALYGLNQRPDVLALNVNLYDFAWYRAGLQQRYPEHILAAGAAGDMPALERLVQEIARQRPLYRAEPLDLVLPGLREAPAGNLVRLAPDE